MILRSFFSLFFLILCTLVLPAQVTFQRTYSGFVLNTSVLVTFDKNYMIVNSNALIKTDVYGNVLWNKVYSDGEIRSVEQTSDSGFIHTGKLSVNGTSHFFLRKTDSTGTEKWTKKFLIDSITSFGNSVKQTYDGGYIITGADLTVSVL